MRTVHDRCHAEPAGKVGCRTVFSIDATHAVDVMPVNAVMALLDRFRGCRTIAVLPW
jgi:hypothetical protein